MSENKHPIGGYAPGSYQCKCSTCEKSFLGDKQAVQCEPCALASLERFNALSPAEQEEVLKRNAVDKQRISIEDDDQIIVNQKSGMTFQEATFQAGYSKGHDTGYSRAQREFEKAVKPAGAVWVKGAPLNETNNLMQFAADYHSIFDDHIHRVLLFVWKPEGMDRVIYEVIGKGIHDFVKAENIVQYLDESGTAPTELPTFWDVAKAFKWATEYDNKQGEQLVLTEDGQWLLLKEENGVTETEELTYGNVAELFCLQNGFNKEGGITSNKDAIDPQELWDKHSECIDDGRIVMTKDEFLKTLATIK